MDETSNAKLILRFDVESAFALRQESESKRNWCKWIKETLDALFLISKILNRHKVPATFFIVGLLLEKAGSDIASILCNEENYDIQSHTYSHMEIWKSDQKVSMTKFRDELSKTSSLIQKYFGYEPIGFCAPGNFYQGLRGRHEQLATLWEEGYRFIGTDGQGLKHGFWPAPFTQPYWYTDDGFSDLLELPLTGWHCNMLFNTGGQNNRWRPGPGIPDGTILEKLPRTVEQGFEVRKKEFEYAISNNLIYAPCMHPWSICRFDPELNHLDRLIVMAKHKDITIMNCIQLYENITTVPL